MIILFLLSLPFPILGFFLQSYPRFFNKFFGVDVWTRLLETDLVRQNGHRIPYQTIEGQFIIPGRFDYPPLFPWLMSYLSKDRLLALQGFVAPAFDSLHTFSIFWISFALTKNLSLSLLAQVLYVTTPMVALENSYLTPRSLGYLLFSLSASMWLSFFYLQQPAFAVIGLLTSVLLFLAHRFAVQSFAFFAIFFTLWTKSPLLLLVFFFSLGFALLITRGYYWRVLKGHLFNIYFWVRNLDFRFAHQVRGIAKVSKKKEFLERANDLLSKLSPIGLIALQPWSGFGLLCLALSWLNFFKLPDLYGAFGGMILFFYLLATLVLSIKFLMPIGEGQRYLEMITFPSVFLTSYLFFLIQKSPSPFPIIATITLVLSILFSLTVIVFLQIKGIVKDRNRSLTTDLQKTFDFMNAQKTDYRLICIPHQNTTLAIYRSKAAVLVNADNPGLMKIQDVFPILRRPLPQVKKKFKLTHALVRETFVSLKELGLESKNIEYSSGDVKLVRL